MQARYVSASVDELLDPLSSVWTGRSSEKIQLVPTPLGMQPTMAIRARWEKRPYGKATSVQVSVAHNGEVLAFHLEWEDATENGPLSDNDSFADGAAIAFPVHDESPLITMGAPGKAVNAWYWRADENGRGRQVSSEGLGTSDTLDTTHVKGNGVWKNGRWQAVITRPLQVESAKPVVQLEVGKEWGFGVAVWDGGNQERAGVKAFSPGWTLFEIEAAGGQS